MDVYFITPNCITKWLLQPHSELEARRRFFVLRSGVGSRPAGCGIISRNRQKSFRLGDLSKSKSFLRSGTISGRRKGPYCFTRMSSSSDKSQKVIICRPWEQVHSALLPKKNAYEADCFFRQCAAWWGTILIFKLINCRL